MNEDRLSLKNILFTKAFPNITPPFATAGYKVFSCTDCGDKFVFESSYDYHVNRKSLKISYMCRHCGETKVFFNRCKLLAHIRSHAFRTATINVTDLQLEPLPLSTSSNTSCKELVTVTTVQENKTHVENKKMKKVFCYDCKMDISSTGILHKDRANHYMKCQTKNLVCYTCPVCLFSLPTSCALKVHVRIHLKQMPIICPECGISLTKNTVNYPYNHFCEGFNMIRATTRLKCFDNKCEIFHPTNYREHMMNHIRIVYRCPICYFKWYDEPPKTKHTLCNNGEVNIVCYFKCPVCPGRFFTKAQINRHLNKHFENINVTELKSQVFPCRACGDIFKDVNLLLFHQVKKHNAYKGILDSVLKMPDEKSKGIYKVIKRCEKCQRSFIYRCQYENIKLLPNECPYNCACTAKSNDINEHSKIICFKCKNKIDSSWNNIKKHFAKFHNTIKCLDINVEINQMDLELELQKINRKNKKCGKIKKKSQDKKRSKVSDTAVCANDDIRNKSIDTKVVFTEKDNEFVVDMTASDRESTDNIVCHKCGIEFDNKEHLETHMVNHRDPCTAYQCLECGQCFVVKPSFSKHLLLEHGIDDVQEYIDKKNCFNKFALDKTQKLVEEEVQGPLEQNQCAICREKFQDQENLEKHFRVHGMAFLMKNKLNEKS